MSSSSIPSNLQQPRGEGFGGAQSSSSAASTSSRQLDIISSSHSASTLNSYLHHQNHQLQYQYSQQHHSLPQQQQQQQQYSLPLRPGPLSPLSPMQQQQQQQHLQQLQQQLQQLQKKSQQPPQHSYSRSSPAGLQDQKYVPFNPQDDGIKQYPQTPQQQQKHHFSAGTNPAQSLQSIQSPLALDQIRPRANSNFGDDGGLYQDLQPTNSNFVAPWAVFAFDWCKYPTLGGNSAGKMALGSYLEDPHNFIHIIDTTNTLSPVDYTPDGGIEYTRIAEATCSYPVTRILWEPPLSQKTSTSLLATSGDHLRLWSLPASTPSASSNTINRSSTVNTREPPTQKLTPLALLSNSKSPEHTAPLTSLDWNQESPEFIITSSIDTTCTIWDIPTLTAKTQLIAHDKEVFDVRFCAGSAHVFVSCGADGSVRMFDLRSLDHSTIIYEPNEKQSDSPPPPPSPSIGGASQNLVQAPPLLRLAASPHDSHLLATFAADSSSVRILDVRQPGQALLELRGHSAALNALEWSPNRRGILATVADDSMVLVWDLLNSANGASLNGLDRSNNRLTASAPVSTASTVPNTPSSATATVGAKGPANWWRCDFEPVNLSWAPQSGVGAQKNDRSGMDRLAVAGGKGVWSVNLNL